MRAKLEEFDGEVVGAGAYGDHGDEIVGAHADNSDVAGILVDGEEKILLRIEAERGRGLTGWDGEALVGVAVEAAIDNVDRDDAIGRSVGNIHEAGIGAEDGARGRGAEHHVIADFVSGSVDDLEPVGFGGD